MELEGAVVSSGAVDRDPVGGVGNRVETGARALVALPAAGVGRRDRVQGAEGRSAVDGDDGVEIAGARVELDGRALGRGPRVPDRVAARVARVIGLAGLLGGEPGGARPVPAERGR